MTARSAVAASLLAAAYALPIAGAVVFVAAEAAQAQAWRELWVDPQTLTALATSVFVALSSSGLALLLSLWLVAQLHGTRAWSRLVAALGPMLALPHAAFAIGFALLLMPSGLLTRLVAPLAGWDAPPPWQTVNDPLALGLVAVLTLKELPFVLWNIVALFARPEVSAALKQQLAVGRTLGYRAERLWWRVLWPQWLPRLGWPLLAVLAYGATAVEVALIAGPLAPPTLAVLAWQWLADANVARNAQGAAAALLLALVVAALALLAITAAKALDRLHCAAVRRGDRGRVAPRRQSARAAAPLLLLVYSAVLALLAVMSLVGVWSFPSLVPQQWTFSAWQQVAASLPVLTVTLLLGLLSATTALAMAIGWLESVPARFDAVSLPVIVAPLVLPSLLLAAGLYRFALALRIDGSLVGLWAVHTLMALPYALLALAPAWRSFDRRYEWTALALGRSRAAFFWRIKLPLLAAPTAAAFAIGFAVSVAQYLPTLFVGAGRISTVTTEAVTLAAGGQRHGAAAWALLQALLPALVFGLAWLASHRRAS